MLESLEHSLQDKLGQKITAEILEQNHYDAQVAEAVRQVKERCSDRQTRLAETVSAETQKGTGQSLAGRRRGCIRGDD